MDFYKKRNKTGAQEVLIEKEYKCASLQAITNETVKQSNYKRIKELIQEINGHLTDLRGIRIDNDDKSEKKRQNLIELFEGCLYKLLQPKQSDDIFIKLNSQLEDIRKQCNNAIQERSVEDLRKLSTRAERNLQVLKNLDKSTDKNAADDYALLIGRYEELYNIIKNHFNSERISKPMTTEEYLKINENQTNDMEPTGNKLLMKNEIEKVMQQKRASQLSTGIPHNNAAFPIRHPFQALNQVSESDEVGIVSSNRNMFEKHTTIKQSDSFKSDGQRTPKQIRKMFSCISPPSNEGSIEDLTDNPIRRGHDAKSVVESYSVAERLKEIKAKESNHGNRSSVQRSELNVATKKTSSSEKSPLPIAPPRLNVRPNDYENVQLQKPKPPPVLPKSVALKKYERNSDPGKLFPPLKKANSSEVRKSLNDKYEPIEKLPVDYIMTVNPPQVPSPEPTPERHSFTTFKTTSDNQEAEIKQEKQEHRKFNLRSYGGTYVIGRGRRPTLTSERRSLKSVFEMNVRDIEQAIKEFKGLKYDTEYLKIDKRLAKFYVEIEDCNEYSDTDDMRKEILLRRLLTAADDLKSRIVKNEMLLRDILEEQASLIAAHYNITR